MKQVRESSNVHKTVKLMGTVHKNKLLSIANSSKSDINKSKLSKSQITFYQARKVTQFGKALLNQPNVNNVSINPLVQEEEGYLAKQTKTLKEMIDTANSDQRALSLIDDTLELFNNQKLKEKGSRDRERYELINKEEFEKMKKDNEEFKRLRKILTEEYSKIKEAYEKVNFELSNMNYTYFSVEKQKKDSITKIYQIENDVKRLLVNNCKLNNEIAKEQIEKDNIFRALNEFSKKYESNKLPQKLSELFKRIKTEKYSPMFNVDHKEKIGILEEKIIKMKKELEEKDKKIVELKFKTQKHNE